MDTRAYRDRIEALRLHLAAHGERHWSGKLRGWLEEADRLPGDDRSGWLEHVRRTRDSLFGMGAVADVCLCREAGFIVEDDDAAVEAVNARLMSLAESLAEEACRLAVELGERPAPPQPLPPSAPPPRRDLPVALVLLAYTAVVHTVDALGLHQPLSSALTSWEPLRRLSGVGFDFFKFLAWFVVPFVLLLALRRIDWGYFGVRRWRRMDLFVLGGLALAGLVAVLSIRIFPSLQDWYPSLAHLSADAKRRIAVDRLVWTFSWIVGWEFIHRYALLTQLTRVWPRYGWLLIPLFEGLYHLQKAPLEAIGMVLFSIVLTWWALLRQNTLLPFLAHLTVELELLLFQLAG